MFVVVDDTRYQVRVFRNDVLPLALLGSEREQLWRYSSLLEQDEHRGSHDVTIGHTCVSSPRVGQVPYPWSRRP